MESLRQVGSGLLFALVCIAIVIGGFSLSMAEGGIGAVVVPPTDTMTSAPIIPPTLPPVTPATLPVTATTGVLFPATATDTPEPIPTATFTPPPPPTSCPPPSGWLAVVVQPYDTLASLAQTYRTSTAALRQGNCLVSDQLVSGSFIYVPPLPTATSVPCGAPAGWVNYKVQPGDTLFSISQRFRVTIGALQRANCLGGSTYIQSGKFIKVPNVATSTLPVIGPTATLIVIEQPSSTPTPTVTNTEIPSPTSPPPTDTQTPPPTDTDTPAPPTETTTPEAPASP
jgi:LysM repeat protein